jgi:hypothetical protein
MDRGHRKCQEKIRGKLVEFLLSVLLLLSIISKVLARLPFKFISLTNRQAGNCLSTGVFDISFVVLEGGGWVGGGGGWRNSTDFHVSYI